MLNRLFSTSLLVALFAVLFGVTTVNAQDMDHSKMMKDHPAIDVTKSDTNMDGKVYVCSMGCAVSDEEGRCPKCEMKLKEMSVADAESMLKEKGFEVADHSKMKKACGSDCDKSCCEGKEVSEAKKSGSESAKTKDAVSESKAFNSVCPVSGKAVSDSSPVAEYNGKNYGFCCPGCIDKFKSNPAKYSSNLNEEGTKFTAS